MDDSKRSGPPAGLRHTGDEPHLLREVVRTSQALMSVFSQEVGMPGSRVAILRLLALAHPAGLGVMELARRMGINAAAVTRHATELEQRRLLVRKPDQHDGRRSSLTLTARGLRVFRELHDRGHELERSLLGDVTDEEIAIAVRVLGRLRSAIEELQAGGNDE